MWSRPGRQAEAASALTNKPNHQNESNSMNNKFDELTKQMAQSVTRRAALKRFGVGLAGMALTCFGLANSAKAAPKNSDCGCVSDADCNGTSHCSIGACVPKWCDRANGNVCCCYRDKKGCWTAMPQCDGTYGSCQSTCAGICLP